MILGKTIASFSVVALVGCTANSKVAISDVGTESWCREYHLPYGPVLDKNNQLTIAGLVRYESRSTRLIQLASGNEQLSASAVPALIILRNAATAAKGRLLAGEASVEVYRKEIATDGVRSSAADLDLLAQTSCTHSASATTGTPVSSSWYSF